MLENIIYQCKRPYHFIKTGLLEGLPAEISTGFPQRKLNIIAITGTDGKTTSSTLLYHVLKTAGKKVGLISTVAAYIGEEENETGFHVTAPQPRELYHFMAQMVKEGYEYLILEATSHGIYQYRTWGIKPLVAGVTNITHEHLDYHITYDNYVAAKALLLQSAKTAVINSDDASTSRLRKVLRSKKATVIEYSAQSRLPKVIQHAANERFAETYNQSNVRLVTAIAKALDIASTDIAQAILSFPAIPGRMQEIPNRRQLKIIVDFAHTPQGLQAALTSLHKELKPGKKLIAVFGCAGLRDRAKRPLMTEIALEWADLVILTAEDPRTENVWSIIRQMKEQLTSDHAKIVSIADRGEAIAFALKQAKAGDTIGIFGKGHEQSMAFGHQEYPWSDQKAVKELLAGKALSNSLPISPSDKWSETE